MEVFASEVQALVEVIEDIGNPFMEESGDLLVLDTRDTADPAVVTTVRGIEKKGHDQNDSFVTDRLVERTSPVSDTISKISMPLFNRPSKRTPSKATQMITSLKSDCALFSRLYIACRTRDGDLDNFFKHANHAEPTILVAAGKIAVRYKARSHRLPGEAVHIQRRSSSHRRHHTEWSCYHQHAEASWSENLPRLCHVSVPFIHQSTVG